MWWDADIIEDPVAGFVGFNVGLNPDATNLRFPGTLQTAIRGQL